MNYKRVLKPTLTFLLILSIAIPLFAFQTNAEELELVESKNTKEDCVLQYQALNGQWKNEGACESNGNGGYTLTSNGWAHWENTDGLSFGYVPVDFNYTDDTQITIETTMTSWNGTHDNAGAGLMIRSGLDIDRASVMFHLRPTEMMATYRMKDGGQAARSKTLSGISCASMCPITFRMVLVKGENKIACSYKVEGQNQFVSFATVPFTYGETIYIGISAYSQIQDVISTAKFSEFHYKIEAPEGWAHLGEGGSGESSTEKEEDILPEDMPVSKDTLLRETFTDNSMVDGDATITNPIWRDYPRETADMDIVTNEDKTNRYLSLYMEDNIAYFAGEQGYQYDDEGDSKSWTDYKMTTQFCFTNEYAPEESNSLIFFVRHTDIIQYGHQTYFVAFRTYNKKRVLVIGKSDMSLDLSNIYSCSNSGTTSIYEETAIELDYLASDFVDKWHSIEITVFDNTIQVNIDDGQYTTSYTDTDMLCKTEGNIGFMSKGAAVLLDNIEVTKLYDPIGGDYDNRIGGNWDVPLPDYLNKFEELGMDY